LDLRPKYSRRIATRPMRARQRPSPYRRELVARAIHKIAADLHYRTPASNRPLRYAVLERAQAEAVLRGLKSSRWRRPTTPAREHVH
jgi:hypothetical protein